MGKRELVIIAGFLVAGAIVYQLTAPPPGPGQRAFSFTQLFAGLRREIGEQAASARVTRTGAIPLPASARELRLTTPRSVAVTITGDRRGDVAYDLPVESTGPDEATAREWAERVELRQDDLGVALALSLHFPPEGTQTATLALRVPASVRVRVENAARVEIARLAAVELRSLAGQVRLDGIAGEVTGSHRAGEVAINGAGTVALTLASSRGRFRDIRNGISLNARAGECLIAASAGPVQATLANADVTVVDHAGAITATGDGGRLTVTQPRGELTIDMRRTLVEIVLGPEAPGPLTAVTSEEPLRLSLLAGASLTVDAAATNGGRVRAADLGLSVEPDGSRAGGAVGGGRARVVLRNSRGDIVIAPRK